MNAHALSNEKRPAGSFRFHQKMSCGDGGLMISADRDRVAAAIIGALDQDAAHAHGAHFGEGDFLL
jgi:hypothetical protein